MKVIKLWDEVPGECSETPVLEYYPTEKKKTSATVVICPGGAYKMRAGHEGEGYAEYFNSIGMDAFVCEYRVSPHRFPLPLLDIRRSIRYVRAHAEEFGINPEMIAVMGSSAGGHLSALVSNYREPIDGEGCDDIDALPATPNATILCYPVIHNPDESGIGHSGSFKNLLGDDEARYPLFACDSLVSPETPPAFIWHTSDDVVDVRNSYLYAAALRANNIKHELHVFHKGHHGLGLAKSNPHVAQWVPLMKNWLKFIGWYE